MSLGNRRDLIKFSLIAAWLVFTVAFALWWGRFSIEHISLLAKLDPSQVEHWDRQRRMIMWEGISWIVLLIIGGAALIALVERERWRSRRVREFFASFSHEIKTSLASLRLQAEALKEESSQPPSPILDRLIGDTVRLQLQLENSLFLASQYDLQLYIQPLSVRDLLDRMREQWPDLKINMAGECTLRADERAMRTVLSNLLQNAIVHGGATQVAIEAKVFDSGHVRISLEDNGRGFEGSMKNLGQLFHRPRATSGSGLGLYICRLLLRRMGGDLTFVNTGRGFHARIEFERAGA
jgi:signal transduction histidine kinase